MIFILCVLSSFRTECSRICNVSFSLGNHKNVVDIIAGASERSSAIAEAQWAEVTAAAPARLPTQVDYSTYFTSSQAWLGTVISWLSW